MKNRSQPNVVKLTRTQVRTLVNEAIQHKPIGEPEPQLHEAGPDPLRVDVAMITQKLEEDLDDVFLEEANGFVNKFENTIIRRIARIMNSHGVNQDNVKPGDLYNDMNAMEPDGMMGAAQECIASVTNALGNYAKALAEHATMVMGGNEEPLQ